MTANRVQQTPTPRTDELRKRMAKWMGNRQARAHEADAIVTCEQLEIELAGLREKVEWIAVRDGLPEDGIDCLTIVSPVFGEPFYMVQPHKKQEHEAFHGWRYARTTHWQPIRALLPAPPAGKG